MTTIDPTKVKEAAMLLLTPAEAAQYAGVSTAAIVAALRGDDGVRAAWEEGRLAVRRSNHRYALAAAKDGNVAAMKFVESVLDRQSDMLAMAGEEDDVGDLAAGDDDVDALLRDQLEPLRIATG